MGSNSHRYHRIPSTTTYIHTDPSNFKAIVQHLTGRPSTTTSTPPPVPYHPFFLLPPPPTLTHQNTHPQVTRPEPDLRFRMDASRTHNYNANQNTQQQVNKPEPHLGFKINASGTHNHNNIFYYFPAMLPLEGRPLTGIPTVGTGNGMWEEEEERAIAEKGFYLHPRVKKGYSDEPRLLPLFPLQAGFAAVTRQLV